MRMTAGEIKEEIEEIRNLDLANIPFEEVFERIRRLMINGYEIRSFPGRHNFVYRARKTTNEYINNLSQIWALDPAGVVRYGRVNWLGFSVFYCADSCEVAIEEIHPKVGDLITVMRCRNTNVRNMSTIGFGFRDNSTLIFSNGNSIDLSKHRTSAFKMDEDSLKKNKIIDLFFNDVFRDNDKLVCSYGDYRYKITAALAKMYFDNPNPDSSRLNCICYPSVSSRRNATNYAIINDYACEYLIPDSFRCFKTLDETLRDTSALRLINSARGVGPDKTIPWDNDF